MSCCGEDARGPRTVVERVRVLSNERIAEGVGSIVLAAPQVARAIEPGQFVHLRIAEGAAFILRRPFSVHRAADGRLQVLYQVLGVGTRALSLLGRDATMDLIGPLGNGWRVPAEVRHALVVCGGLGAAPMGMLVERLAARGIAVSVAQGAPCAERLVASAFFRSQARRYGAATDDGSAGTHGLVTLVSARMLAEDRPDVAYVCGPEAMERAVAAQTASAGIACQVSLERLMACGVGACLSCVVMTRGGQRRTCVDGPVFDAADLCWEAPSPAEGRADT